MMLFRKPRRMFESNEAHSDGNRTQGRIVFARRGNRSSFWALLGIPSLLALLVVVLFFGIGIGIFVLPLFLVLYVLIKPERKPTRRGYFDRR